MTAPQIINTILLNLGGATAGYWICRLLLSLDR